MEELKDLREKIDAIDQQMVDLFKQRMEVSKEVAAYKQANGLPTLDAGRERALLGKVGEQAGEELADYTQSVYRTILAAGRSYQNACSGVTSKVYETIRKALDTTPDLFPQRATVACQGVEGAYSQIACDSIFKAPTVLYFNTFEHVFKAVESGMCQYGVLPIENSTAGSVNAIYDLMTKHNFSIVRSARLKVSHNLLCKHGVKKEDIKEIFSHQQAISQCAGYLSTLKGVKVTVVENTALAAQMVAQSERRDVARPVLPLLRRALRSQPPGAERPGPGQQLHPLHLHLQESRDLPRGRPHLSDDDPAPQAWRPLQCTVQVLRPGHQPAQAGEPSSP